MGGRPGAPFITNPSRTTSIEKTTTMERNDSHLHLHLTDHNSPEDVIDVLFREAFISGPLRHARKANLPRVKPHATMLPARVRPLRLATTGKMRSVLAG